MDKFFQIFALCAGVALCASCSESSGRHEPDMDRPQPAPHIPTPEEELGIVPPGVLDSAVAAWAKGNELGDYYEQSQRRLELARSKLLDDYRVRKGMDAPPTSFTKEWIAKYREAKSDDDGLRLHILECYSRGVVRPLPDNLRGRFADSSERRRRDSELASAAPSSLDAMERTQREIASAMNAIGTLSWEMQKALSEWQALATKLAGLAERAKTLSAEANGLSERLSRLASAKPEDDGLAALERRSSRLRRDVETLALRVGDAQGIAEGQTALASFAAECRRMSGWMRSLDARCAAKAARIAQEQEWRRRVLIARKNGNRAEIAAAVSALSGFRSVMAQDKADGDAARKDVMAFKRYADDAQFRKFKRMELPEGARAGADALREGVFRAIPAGRTATGFLEVLESKAFKLHDDYEEKTAIAEIEGVINR